MSTRHRWSVVGGAAALGAALIMTLPALPAAARPGTTARLSHMPFEVGMRNSVSRVGPVSGARQPSPLTMLQWQAQIGRVRAVGSGCFRASFPTLAWHAVKCVSAPDLPFAPALPSSRKGPADKVGNGVDYAAVVSGLISKATGTFTHVSPKIHEKGQIGGSGTDHANAFSLQLNTQFFHGSPACAGASNPSKCLAWQQFVYAGPYGTSSNDVFMQYWLINYNATCPAGWNTYVVSSTVTYCWVNSSASTLSSALTAKSLATLSLSGSAKSGGNDQVEVVNAGQATLATGPDSMLGLSGYWNTSEWGVYGDAGGGEAIFGTGTTLEAVTTLTATSSAAPTCVKEGFTAETNNLKLAATAPLGSETSPTMGSNQTNGKPGTASCAVAG